MTVEHQPSGKQFTGKHMLLVLFGFFGTIVAVNLLLSWFAVGTWSGLVAKNGYVASLEFKEKQAESDRQKKLGWTDHLNFSENSVQLEIRDKTGAGVEGLKLLADIGRPTTEKFDMPLVFTSLGDGKYHANTNLEPGQWELQVRGTGKTGQHFTKKYRFVIPDRK